MKKILILPLFVMVSLISQAWGAWAPCSPSDFLATLYCQWPTGCYEINKGENDTDNCTAKRSECIDKGYLYTGVSPADVGDNKICKNSGTWTGDGKDPNFNGGTPIWCQWTTGCYSITDAAGLENCKTNGFVYKGVTNAGDGKTCNGTWAEVGNDPNFNGGVAIWCQWYSPTSCYSIMHDTTLTKCIANGSVYKEVTSTNVGEGKTCNGTWTGQGRNPNPPSSSSTPPSSNSSSSSTPPPPSSSSAPPAGNSSSSVNAGGTSSSSSVVAGGSSSSVVAGSSSSSGAGTSSSSDGGTPIISHNSAPVVGLNVVNFARSLRIASDKNATISLFDINGKLVLGQKVLSGTTTISLANQKSGVYYAIAKSDSQKQIVKIVLK